MDGVLSGSRSNLCGSVFIVAVTNRPEVVDAAILRPGRLDEHVRIPLPDAEARTKIFRGILSNVPNSLDDSDIAELVVRTAGSSGADIDNMCREAALGSLRRDITSNTLKASDFL
ncbi:P-loop containing nucleoside triphosphate hydrolase protein [Blyttiomyces helicus]|uniref:P-loop containing nucleoside triphosphate hydrolase protein n=1 Tax=Blyttiomyces helicus TaxID=388810 RepID=A0A4P9W3S6_9FUNG|nr:P-loop containing nucleoside triphosphate hydrolase protein [Blyttiomyces helicus]|eukprot:RKO86979.1 P-loop containing nucleoside triphosphate hydrolase protein [Blyttiomyces helicus]